MPRPNRKTPLRDLKTYGRSRAVRLSEYDYASDGDIHVVLCTREGTPFHDTSLATLICENVEFYAKRLGYRLYGYCLMPDHLHVLFSPADSGRPLRDWLRDFKSFTTNQWRQRKCGSRLWQESAYDHVCRSGETAETVLTYIVDNPVRAGLVKCWQEWSWTKVFIEV